MVKISRVAVVTHYMKFGGHDETFYEIEWP